MDLLSEVLLRWRKKPSYSGQKKSDDIVKVTMEAPPRATKTHKEPILIYPGFKTIDDKPPFNHLYKYFGEYLDQAHYCIIIGCSFRDKRLNDIFLESLKNNSNLELVIISPNAEETMKKASEFEFSDIIEYWDRLIFKNEPFDEDFNSDFLLGLKLADWKRTTIS